MTKLLKNYAYDILIQKIWCGELEANTIYSLTKISQELKISRTPLRDAIQMLSDEKRIDILPSRGFRLHKLTKTEILQRYHLSIALEGYAIMRLIEKYETDKSNEYVKKLETCVEKMKHSSINDIPFRDRYELDNQFHNTLVDSLDDNFPEYLSIKDHGFINIPELHIYAKSLDLNIMLKYNINTLEYIKDLNREKSYLNMIDNATYVYNVYMKELEKDNEVSQRD